MNRHAFIFARGGSKGLKKKNIKIFGGKPLIAHSILQAHESQAFDKVFVSTENEEIASIAESYGAEIIIRPNYLANDDSPEWLAWQHAALEAEERFGRYEYFVSLPATSPLRNKDDILKAINHLDADKGADLCLGICQSSKSPYFNMVIQNKKNYLELAYQTTDVINRRQDAPPIYNITTVVYAAKTDFIKRNNNIFAGSVIGFEIPKERAVDIDDILDFQFAEFLYNKFNHAK
jgi:N,N'-diacetyl-8-epilegionaminate cytidylyltransferase